MAHKVIVPPKKNYIPQFLKQRDIYARDNLRGQKSLGPLKMSLEMAHKVIVPPKKNYIPQFLKQRDINSYSTPPDTSTKCGGSPLRACEEVVEIHEDANPNIHESHEGRMAPTTKPTKFES